MRLDETSTRWRSRGRDLRRTAWLLVALASLIAGIAASAWSLGCRRPTATCRYVPKAVGASTAGVTERRPSIAHAHNDYQHARPLHDALEHGFTSVEADVWWHRQRIKVSHYGFTFKGLLSRLYLDPLQERVNQLGSVHGDNERFTLWIDIKDDNPALARALRELLDRYPMLSRRDGTQQRGGMVDVVLTGHEDVKRRVVGEGGSSPATRDSLRFDGPGPADPTVTHYSLDWSQHIAWNGEGAISAVDRDALRCIIDAAHDQGRRIRFYGAPDTASFWHLAKEMHVDFISTDRLTAMAEFLRAWGRIGGVGSASAGRRGELR